MALQCNLTLNTLSVAAGQPAYATLQVFNPNASTVVVTGVSINFKGLNDALPGHTAALPTVAAIGQGQTVAVPTLSSINIGPFPVVVPSTASVNAFQTVTGPSNTPINPQGSQPTPVTIVIGADVYGSDGSLNTAGTAALIVGPAVASPAGFQGGYLNQSAPNNLITFLAVM